MNIIFPTSGMTTVVYDGFRDYGVEHEHIDGVMTPIYHWFSFTRGVVTYHYDAVNVWVRVASGGFWFSCDGRASLFFSSLLFCLC